MKRMLFPLLCGALLFTALRCNNPVSRLVGVWELDLEATRKANPEGWKVEPPGETMKLNADGTFRYFGPQHGPWEEQEQVGKWEIANFQPPFFHPDSLDRFLGRLPEHHEPYYRPERLPEYELVVHLDSIDGISVDSPEMTTMVVILELSPDRLILHEKSGLSIWVYKRMGD